MLEILLSPQRERNPCPFLSSDLITAPARGTRFRTVTSWMSSFAMPLVYGNERAFEWKRRGQVTQGCLDQDPVTFPWLSNGKRRRKAPTMAKPIIVNSQLTTDPCWRPTRREYLVFIHLFACGIHRSIFFLDEDQKILRDFDSQVSCQSTYSIHISFSQRFHGALQWVIIYIVNVTCHTLVKRQAMQRGRKQEKWANTPRREPTAAEVYSCPLHAKIMACIMFSLPLVSL